eukprot:scpid56617/ scgid25802/ 
MFGRRTAARLPGALRRSANVHAVSRPTTLTSLLVVAVKEAGTIIWMQPETGRHFHGKAHAATMSLKVWKASRDAEARNQSQDSAGVEITENMLAAFHFSRSVMSALCH